MFSSEQIMEISGGFEQLELTLNFALNMHGAKPDYGYQITKDGKYCIGWMVKEDDGWLKFPFDFDSNIVSKIIEQHLRKQNIPNDYEYFDGGSEKGFLMKVIPETFADEYNGIKKPFYGIVSFEPFYIYFSK